MAMTRILEQLRAKALDTPLTVEELACALYEGKAHVQNLAEKSARNYGQAGALTLYDMTSDDIQNFWRGIAKQIIEHSSHWLPNEGSACRLDDAEAARLAAAPRVTEGGLDKCDQPPAGWFCTRSKGHDGPCAAVPLAKQQ